MTYFKGNHALIKFISQGISLQKSTYIPVGNHLWTRIALLNLIISASIRDTSFYKRKPHIIVCTKFVEAKVTWFSNHDINSSFFVLLTAGLHSGKALAPISGSFRFKIQLRSNIFFRGKSTWLSHQWAFNWWPVYEE